jgi:hypothetical protein
VWGRWMLCVRAEDAVAAAAAVAVASDKMRASSVTMSVPASPSRALSLFDSSASALLVSVSC